MENIKIGTKEIGICEKPYFIADIAANHDGNLERAYKLIELAKEAGADAAKFQNFVPNKIVSDYSFSNSMPNISHQSSWTKSVYEVYNDASVPAEWSCLLKEKCDSVGIEYMTSPYDFDNVDLADNYSNAFKIGSGDITWVELIKYIASKNKPILLATGASSISDVKRAVSILTKESTPFVLMQCNTNYTASDENLNYINLNVLKTYKEIFPNVILGLSDHTFGHETVLGAITLGARVIEKHFTDDNLREGPDHKFAMNPESWRNMVVSGIKLFNSLGNGIKKVEQNEEHTFIVQRRCMHYTHDMFSGETITEKDIFPLRPNFAGGFQPFEKEFVIGKVLLTDVKANSHVKKGDVVGD